MSEATVPSSLIELASQIVSAYVTRNAIPVGDIAALISSVHQALTKAAIGKNQEPAPTLTPAVPIKKSITPDYLISLFDGRKYKSLKRHLRTHHNMTPDQYRAHWGLSPDYPMVAPNYAKARSNLAKSMGLGQQHRKATKGGRKAA